MSQKKFYVVGPAGLKPGATASYKDIAENQISKEMKAAIEIVDTQRPSQWPSMQQLICLLPTPVVIDDAEPFTCYEVSVPNDVEYHRPINLDLFFEIVASCASHEGELPEYDREKLSRRTRAFWEHIPIGHASTVAYTADKCTVEKVMTNEDTVELNNKNCLRVHPAYHKPSPHDLMRTKGSPAELVKLRPLVYGPNAVSPVDILDMESVALEQADMTESIEVTEESKGIKQYAASLDSDSIIIIESKGERYFHGEKEKYSRRIPKENRCIGSVYVEGQMMELWELKIPHNYGVWNDRNPFLWLRYRSNIGLAAYQAYQSMCNVRDVIDRNSDILGQFETPVEELSNQMYDTFHKYANTYADEEWLPWLGETYDAQRGLWGYKLIPSRYLREKWDDIRINKHMLLQIFCNGRLVYSEGTYQDVIEATAHANHIIQEMTGELGWFDFVNPESNIGRKIYYYGQPAVIDRIILDQTCVMIKHENGKAFDIRRYHERHPDYKDDDGFMREWDGASEIKDSIFSDGIYPYRSTD